MTLYIDVGPDDALRIGEDMYITVERKSGSRARLRLIGRQEVELMRNAKSTVIAAPARFAVNQADEE